MALSTWNKTGNVLNFWYTSFMSNKDPQLFYPGRNYKKGIAKGKAKIFGCNC